MRPGPHTALLAALAALAASGFAARAAQPAAAPARPPAPAAAAAAPHGPAPAASAGGGHLAGIPTAAPADVASPDAVVAAYYQSISGPAGKKRDWNRFLSLFFPGARLLPAEGRGHAGKMPELFSPDSYLYNTEPSMLATGYIEKEIARRSQGFGRIMQVWSTYKVLHADSDPKPFVRGVASFLLYSDGSRWWIFSLAWQPETARLPLPPELLR